MLHKALLALKEFCPSFTRKKANDLICKAQTNLYQEHFKGSLRFDENDEPTIASLWETENQGDMSDVTIEQMREFLAKKFGEGDLTYDEAFAKMREFNTTYSGSKTFMGTITFDRQKRCFRFEVVYNSIENQEKLIDTIQNVQSWTIFKQKLESLGIGIDTLDRHDAMKERGVYNTIDPKEMNNGLLGVISLQDPTQFDYKTLANEVGHFIVGSLMNSKANGHQLVERLYNIIANEANKEVIQRIMGDEYNSIMIGDNSSRSIEVINYELMGHLIAKYLIDESRFEYKIKPREEGFKAETKQLYNNIKTFVQRILKTVSRNFHNITRGYFLTVQGQTKWAARKLAKDFLGDNFHGTLTNALQNKQVLHSDYDDQKKYIGRVLQQLWQIQRQFSVVGLNTSAKNLSDALKVMNADYVSFKQQDFPTSIEMADMCNNVLNLYLATLNSVLEAIDLYTDPSITVFEEGQWNAVSSAIIMFRKLQDMKSIMTEDADLSNIRSYLEEYLNNQPMSDEERQALENAKLALDKMNQITDSINQAFTNDFSKGNTINTVVDNLEDKMVKSFMVAINGNDTFFIPASKSFNGKREEQYKNVDALIKEISEQEEQGFMSRLLYSLGSSPDIVNQILHMSVDIANRTADQRSVKLLQRVKQLFQKFQKLTTLGINTSIFYEQSRGTFRFDEKKDDYVFVDDNKMHFTGNFLTKSRQADWARAKARFLHNKKKTWKEKNLKTDDNPTGKYATWIQAKNSNEYKEVYNTWINEFNAKNSMKINITDYTGKEIIDPFNEQPRQQWVPYNSVEAERLGIVDLSKTDWKNQDYYNLSQPLKDILKDIINLKKEIDEYLPPFMRKHFKAPQFRKNYIGAITSRLYHGDLATSAKLLVKRSWVSNMCRSASEFTQGQDLGGDFADEDENLYGTLQRQELRNIRKVAVFGVRRLKDTDEIVTDPFAALLMYGNMAYTYDVMHQVANQAEVIKYQNLRRRINSSKETRNSGHRSDAQHVRDSLEAYIDRNIYHVRSFQDTNYDNKFAYRLKIMGLHAAQAWSRGTSYLLLGWNVISAYTNLGTGLIEITKESIAGEHYDVMDFVKAFASYALYAAESLYGATLQPMVNIPVKFLTGKELPKAVTKNGGVSENTTKVGLFMKYFNIGQRNDYKKYQFSRFGAQVLRGMSLMDLAMIPYSVTDGIMQSMAFLAAAHHVKVIRRDINGNEKTVSLWSALNAKGDYLWLNTGKDNEYSYYIKDKNAAKVNKFKDKKDGGAYTSELSEQEKKDYLNGIIPLVEEHITRTSNTDELNIFNVDAEGNPINDPNPRGVYLGDRAIAYIQTRMRAVNNRMHGVYNNQDMGSIADHLYTPILLTLKRYAIGIFEKRWKSKRYSVMDRDVVEGMYRTFGKLVWNISFNSFHRLHDKKYSKMDWVMDIAERLFRSAELTVSFLLPGGIGFNLMLGNFMREQGYSESQIANIKRTIVDFQMTTLFNKLGLLFTPVPPDDLDTEDELYIEFINNPAEILKYADEIGVALPDKKLSELEESGELYDLYPKILEAWRKRKAERDKDNANWFLRNTTELINKVLHTHQTATNIKNIINPFNQTDLNPNKINKSQEEPMSPTTFKILNFMSFGTLGLNTEDSKMLRWADDFYQKIGLLKGNLHGNLLGHRAEGGVYAAADVFGDGNMWALDEDGNLCAYSGKPQKMNMTETPYSLNGMRYYFAYRLWSEQMSEGNPVSLIQGAVQNGVGVLRVLSSGISSREGSNDFSTQGAYTYLGEYQGLSEVVPNSALLTTTLQYFDYLRREPELQPVTDNFGNIKLDSEGNPIMMPQESPSAKNSYYYKQGNFKGVARWHVLMAKFSPYRTKLTARQFYKSAGGLQYARQKGLNINVNQ